MLEEPDQPSVARVLRVQPIPGEKPAPGFSWADYEDVQMAAAEDADGEDDGGWGVVKSRSRNSTFCASILILFIDCVSNRARATTANGLTTAEWVRDDQKATPERRQTRSPEICESRGGSATASDSREA